MANLSQSEIDDLVAAMTSVGDDSEDASPPLESKSRPVRNLLQMFEPVSEDIELTLTNGPKGPGRASRNYRLYDFRRPEKLSKDHNRLLKAHFGLFLRRVANYLANLSRSNVDVSLVEVDQSSYKDIFTSHGVPMVMCMFRMGSDQGMLKLNLSHIFSLVERLMGGHGNGSLKPRPLTEFERNLCSEIFSQMLHFYAELRQVDKITIENIETDERLIPRSLPSDELMVRAIYDCRLGALGGYLNLYLPMRCMNAVIGGGDSRQSKPKSSQQGPLPEVVSRMPLPVEVILGSALLPAGEIAALQPGSVIKLDQEESRPLMVQVGKIPRFRASPGLMGNRMAVTIVGRWEVG